MRRTDLAAPLGRRICVIRHLSPQPLRSIEQLYRRTSRRKILLYSVMSLPFMLKFFICLNPGQIRRISFLSDFWRPLKRTAIFLVVWTKLNNFNNRWQIRRRDPESYRCFHESWLHSTRILIRFHAREMKWSRSFYKRFSKDVKDTASYLEVISLISTTVMIALNSCVRFIIFVFTSLVSFSLLFFEFHIKFVLELFKLL